MGAHGHGRWHLENLRRLAATSGVRLVGVCDQRPLEGELRELAGDVPVSASLPGLVADTAPDVTIVCTPIHTHTDLTLAAVDAGSHVLLEKPPTPTLAEFHRLVAGIDASGKACQIGFQSLGSEAIGRVRSLLEDGAIGDVRGIGGACAWIRDASYYGRAAWAGRRTVDGVPVVDGALTNPFAHAVATALAVAGATGPESLRTVEVELYHANPIEADDTSCLRVRTADGLVVTIAATLAAERPRTPRLVVHGSTGRITLDYKTGTVRLQAGDVDETTVHPSTDLLENLLAHVRDPRVRLLVPPRATSSFMEVVEAVRCAPEPVGIPPEHRRPEGGGRTARQAVPGIDDLVDDAAETLQVFSELGAPWARPGTIRRPDAAYAARGR
ncbi:putative dehydrogenase [Geodermatophilus bullaregiensis]|uniref:Gfo/Idh/MocA family protein n=1 Tax=Geodermatophilus bullaregiensis TaxID=1564160 RepID=UPI0027DE5501|nr:Gfo/Idh/MocA family oxidoreductase [Geodermatophilus bullaregiensis]MBM7807913.1 putative dehydrogenase [Geodermatophilus bullaregiensis]